MAYDIGFLGHGVEAPLPTFGPELDGDIVRSSHLRDEIYADYPTFSLVMNSRHRSAAFVALNIDQSRLGGRGSKSWTFDTRVANNLQLNNDYYRQNVWDRGHMARRASAAWGSNQAQLSITKVYPPPFHQGNSPTFGVIIISSLSGFVGFGWENFSQPVSSWEV